MKNNSVSDVYVSITILYMSALLILIASKEMFAVATHCDLGD